MIHTKIVQVITGSVVERDDVEDVIVLEDSNAISRTLGRVDGTIELRLSVATDIVSVICRVDPEFGVAFSIRHAFSVSAEVFIGAD